MKIRPESLNSQLANQLESLYFVFGAEFLLIEQSLNNINTAAKKFGFDEKASFEVDGNFDWSIITAEIANTSLFSPKRIIECRLKTGKIGVKGSKALSSLAANIPNDILLIISTGKLDMAQQKSKWFKTLEQHGGVIQHWEISSDHLVGWISNHMANISLEANKEVAQSIAFYTEGNLLASMQEIQKLKMAYPNGKINTQEFLEQAQEQSKYTIYGLIDAALFGDAIQVNKIYNTLLGDTAMPIQLNSSLYREIKTIIDMSIEMHQNSDINAILQSHRVWNKRKPIITNILKRHSYQRLQKILLLLGRIDRSIKGMDNLNVIDELRTILLNLAGKNQWAQ
ncbi:DNA polymerase III delta subunit (EC 2.7.7.7) [uncultured Gammaproteobacteria bacterium]|uniref:DNA polymerase III subunit delta n=1 Tax=Bathymodiolus heckerae thiotrophic gill symbiont TaxID=1052212 RepID=UPI0010BA4550|nr:DNA polymerase III subunit delta [Bathymodiolus heckerae thiotrophic gill symbiont]CAC9580713.1 DNA polymerase III delta subunit (EC 2.7.7.7) [uncultured Gammaproteobacteria bacterium]CAC9584176.1 DNA polymerase III delta subunit (EC 2.7.7.7) [uncultured Gammaproteobacteria bacterium]CAC9603367.1 DNA polymerase III delta subunit (EC 2.7.7.7) [uncultured Gammaproteobacteria bacterium]SHN90548.1 DNA polymerase III delta subunit [Bathymodiolus heckerae thiotrophic gill symbiont]